MTRGAAFVVSMSLVTVSRHAVTAIASNLLNPCLYDVSGNFRSPLTPDPLWTAPQLEAQRVDSSDGQADDGLRHFQGL